MCGLYGLVDQEFNFRSNQSRMKAAEKRLLHRGPDDSGLENISLARTQKSVILGHTRLAIIDLTSGGHQPLFSKDERFALVFNGEIYNYKEIRKVLEGADVRFRSASDTEVLLEAWRMWGAACLEKLDGMFSFVVVDRQSSTLWAARDAFGIKPFFYSDGSHGFGFASEIGALFELTANSRLNEKKAIDFLSFGTYDGDEDTFVEGIKTLLPGHLLRLEIQDSGNKLTTESWITFEASETYIGTKESAAEELRGLFLQSVSRQLRSDVPVGVAVSGGLDSSAIVSAVRYLHPDLDIATFSFIAEGAALSEEPWIDLINSNVGATSHKVRVSTSELSSDLTDLVLSQGEPFGSTSIYAQYNVFKRVSEAGIKVSLDGQGADELFAGYHGYADARVISLLSNSEFRKALELFLRWSDWPGRNPKILAMQVAGMLLPRSGTETLRRVAKNLVPVINNDGRVIKTEFQVGNRNLDIHSSPKGRGLARALVEALGPRGITPLLRHGDRNSMRWSVESRVPFLTPTIAKFSLSLPEEYLLSQAGETKSVLRLAMRGIVPDEVLERRDKIGFEAQPIAAQLLRDKKNLDHVRSLEALSFMDKSTLNRAVEETRLGLKNNENLTWRLLSLSSWISLSSIRF